MTDRPTASDSTIEPFTSLQDGATVKDDAADLAAPCRGLLVTVAGNVKITTLAGETHTLTLAVGTWPIMIKRLWSADLTATVYVGR